MDARRFDEYRQAQREELKIQDSKFKTQDLEFDCLVMESVAVVVLTTVSNDAEAETLARKIVAAKLAACVQILPPMRSVYFWDGAIQVDAEHLLLIKTLAGKFGELQSFIEKNHSYETPEIIALSASAVAENYLGWMKNYLEE